MKNGEGFIVTFPDVSGAIIEAALADRQGLSKATVRKLLNLDYRSHISQMMNTIRDVGRSLIVEYRVA